MYVTGPGVLDHGREVKNIFVLFFCTLVVGAGLFEKVKLSFLPVGHTHEDIDQLFSRCAESLRRMDCFSLDDSERIIRSSYHSDNNSQPGVVRNPKVPDFKGWMEFKKINITGHTGPTCFKFQNDPITKDVLMYARGRTSVKVVASQPDEQSTLFPED